MLKHLALPGAAALTLGLSPMPASAETMAGIISASGLAVMASRL